MFEDLFVNISIKDKTVDEALTLIAEVFGRHEFVSHRNNDETYYSLGLQFKPDCQKEFRSLFEEYFFECSEAVDSPTTIQIVSTGQLHGIGWANNNFIMMHGVFQHFLTALDIIQNLKTCRAVSGMDYREVVLHDSLALAGEPDLAQMIQGFTKELGLSFLNDVDLEQLFFPKNGRRLAIEQDLEINNVRGWANGLYPGLSGLASYQGRTSFLSRKEVANHIRNLRTGEQISFQSTREFNWDVFTAYKAEDGVMVLASDDDSLDPFLENLVLPRNEGLRKSLDSTI
ncbi:MAG: hypothetical protein P1U86_22950 [Verrucomicrobiales bacterium]|nr:hypothetical protein [Verrucomicrobiales bacterium]